MKSHNRRKVGTCDLNECSDEHFIKSYQMCLPSVHGLLQRLRQKQLLRDRFLRPTWIFSKTDEDGEMTLLFSHQSSRTCSCQSSLIYKRMLYLTLYYNVMYGDRGKWAYVNIWKIYICSLIYQCMWCSPVDVIYVPVWSHLLLLLKVVSPLIKKVKRQHVDLIWLGVICRDTIKEIKYGKICFDKGCNVNGRPTTMKNLLQVMSCNINI